MAKKAPIKATVMNICGSGTRRYAVTRPSTDSLRVLGDSTVTFSLAVWQSRHDPKPGQIVHLFEVEEFAGGWRARRAEPVRL